MDKEELKNRMLERIMEHPEILVEIKERLETEPIVDEEGKEV